MALLASQARATSDGMMEVHSKLVLVVVAMWPGGRFQLCGDSDLWASSPQSWTDCAVRRRTLGALFLPFKTTLVHSTYCGTSQ